MINKTFAEKHTVLSNAINACVKEFIQNYNIPGAVLSIKLPDHNIETFSAGLANVKTKAPIQPNMLFPIGSITKSFTSASFLELTEQGKLSLQKTLAEIANKHTVQLTELLQRYPALKNISVEELLNHTSGLPSALNSRSYEKMFEQAPLKHWSNAALLEMALKQKLLFPPGTPGKFHYSNTDYILAQIVYNSVATGTLSEAIYKLLQKADIQNAFYPRSQQKAIPLFVKQHLSQGYMPENPYWPEYLMKVFRRYPKASIDNGGRPGLAYNVTAIDVSQAFVAPATGGIIMSAPDMAKWYESLFLKKNILSKSALKKMLTVVPTNDEYGYGLGITTRYLQRFNVKVFSHTGSNFGFNTNLVYIQGHGIVIAAAINAQKDLLRFDKGLIPEVLEILKKYGYLS
jgi:CubicO group peptidase (beta-lactamase class C family)